MLNPPVRFPWVTWHLSMSYVPDLHLTCSELVMHFRMHWLLLRKKNQRRWTNIHSFHVFSVLGGFWIGENPKQIAIFRYWYNYAPFSDPWASHQMSSGRVLPGSFRPNMGEDLRLWKWFFHAFDVWLPTINEDVWGSTGTLGIYSNHQSNGTTWTII